MAIDEEKAEKARVESLRKHAESQRAKEEARRKAHVTRAQSESSLIVHGPVTK